jgi:hypothetical protein
MKVANTEIEIDGRLLRIARLAADGYEFVDDPEPVLSGLRKSHGRPDLFTFMQGLIDPSPRFKYPMEWDNFAAIPISTFDNWWNNQIRSFPRNRARQAEKRGVVLREVPFSDELVQGIWKVYNECPVRQGKPFRHFGKDLKTVYREEATYLDTSLFIGAYLGDELIGFVKMTWDQKKTQANLMNIISMMGHKDKAPTNALIAHSVRACADRGIQYLVYQSFSYGKKQEDSVSHFKEVNGFQKIDIPRYYVPLTAFGTLALRLRLHHKWIDRIPQPIIAKLRNARGAWYNRKLKVVTEAS